MWLIIILLILAFAFFGFEIFRFVTELKRRKHKKSTAQAVDDKGKEVN